MQAATKHKRSKTERRCAAKFCVSTPRGLGMSAAECARLALGQGNRDDAPPIFRRQDVVTTALRHPEMSTPVVKSWRKSSVGDGLGLAEGWDMHIAQMIEQALYVPKDDRRRSAPRHETHDADASRGRDPHQCPACGASRQHIARGRKVAATKNHVFHVAEVWVCKSCDAEWVDEALARLNEWAAEAAALEEDERWALRMTH